MSRPPRSFDPGPPASAYWRGWPEVRADVGTSVRLVLGLVLAGVPAGLVWAALAPRADFRITASGAEPLGSPSDELLVADDAVFALVLAVVGLVAGVAAWQLRRRRGVATVVALAVGAVGTAVVAWQVGELAGAGPTDAQLADVGSVVTTSLTLGSPAAIAVAPFMAVLGYVVRVVVTHDDGLGRIGESPRPDGEPCSPGGPAVHGPDRPMVDVPPGRPRS